MKPRIVDPLVANPGGGGGGGSYVLPVATSGTLGGVKAKAKTDENAEIAIDSNAKLWAKVPAQVQSDWNETDTDDPAYIANKPTIPDVSGKRDLPAAVSVHVIDPNTAIWNVAANTVYTADAALTYLAITAVEASNLESQVWFVAGATAPTVVLPSNVRVIGSITFKASKGYVISFQNGVAVVGEYDVS